MSTSQAEPGNAATTAARPGRGRQPVNEKKVTFLTERLDHLFETVHPKGRAPYSYQEVADAILKTAGPDEDGKPPISASYIWNLRVGRKENPTRRHIALLAAHFGVSPLYFFEEEYDATRHEMELARALKDPKVHELALAATGLSEASLEAVLSLVRSLHKIERGAQQEPSSDID